MLIKQKLLILLLSVSVISPAMAKVYKWTDANGAVHYTSTPPPTTLKVKENKEVKIRKTPKSSLTFKPKYRPSVETSTKKKKKQRVRQSARVKKRSKATTGDKECGTVAERADALEFYGNNGKILVAKGIKTQEENDEMMRFFSETLKVCK